MVRHFFVLHKKKNTYITEKSLKVHSGRSKLTIIHMKSTRQVRQPRMPRLKFEIFFLGFMGRYVV